MAIDYVLHWTDDSLKQPFKLKTQSTNSTKTSLILTGRGATNWGENLQTNMLRLLENFASKDVPPKNPTDGQLWFNATTNYLKVFWQGRWNDVGYNRIDSTTPPPGPYFAGDLWYDTVADRLRVYDVNGSWDTVYQGGIPNTSLPAPTPTPAVPTPVPGTTPGTTPGTVPTPTAPTPVSPTPVPTSPTPVSPTPVPTSPTPVPTSPTPTPVTPTPVTPAPTPTVPTPTTPAPTVPVPTPIPPSIIVASPITINNGLFQVTVRYNDISGTGSVPYLVTLVGVTSLSGTIARQQGAQITLSFPMPSTQGSYTISATVNNVTTSVPVQFVVAPTPVPSTTSNGAPGPVGQDASKFELLWREEFDNPYALNWKTSIWYTSPDPTINYTIQNSCLRVWPQRNANGQFIDRTFTTEGIRTAKYGYIEFRAKLPRGQGLYPALWMFNHTAYPLGTAQQPEIDLMDAYCSGGPDAGWSDVNDMPIAFMSGVWPGPTAAAAGTRLYPTTNISTGFYPYGIKWVPGNIKFYWNGVQYYNLDVQLDFDMYYVISLWYGRTSGLPDLTTPTGPNSVGVFEIDYIRHWAIL